MRSEAKNDVPRRMPNACGNRITSPTQSLRTEARLVLWCEAGPSDLSSTAAVQLPALPQAMVILQNRQALQLHQRPSTKDQTLDYARQTARLRHFTSTTLDETLCCPPSPATTKRLPNVPTLRGMVLMTSMGPMRQAANEMIIGTSIGWDTERPARAGM